MPEKSPESPDAPSRRACWKRGERVIADVHEAHRLQHAGGPLRGLTDRAAPLRRVARVRQSSTDGFTSAGASKPATAAQDSASG